jgi:hypothetical protein
MNNNFIITLLLISSSFLNADILDTLNDKQKNEKEMQEKVFNSKFNSFDKLSFDFDENYKLKYVNNGKITMFISNDYMNIDIKNIFSYIKFDINVDKDEIHECKLISDDSLICSTSYYTVKAADQLSGGLLNFASALLSENQLIKKRFDIIEFSKLIVKNEDYLKQFINRYINSKLSNMDSPSNKDLKKEKISKSTELENTQNIKPKIEEGW